MLFFPLKGSEDFFQNCVEDSEVQLNVKMLKWTAKKKNKISAVIFNVSFFFFVALISFDLLMKQEDQVKAEATLIAYETLHYP